MQFIVLFASLVAAALSSPVVDRQILQSDQVNLVPVLQSDGRITLEEPDDLTLTYTPDLSEVSYYLYTRANRDTPQICTDGIVTVLQNTPFSPDKLTVFITHGWLNDYTSPINTEITAAILDMYDVNVFIVDWSGPAKKLYLKAKSAVPHVGRYQGEFIRNIQTKYNLSGDRFVLIGHSLGAHAAGCAGATLNGTIDTIVGLDPAGPFYFAFNTADRLDPTDGRFVHVIHTDGTFLGYFKPSGHADYYPNGGVSQPGCFFDLMGICAHGRAYEYFAESVKRSKDFYARQCEDRKAYDTHLCDHNPGSVMGGLFVDKTASGTFYLDTNSRAPYGMSQNDLN